MNAALRENLKIQIDKLSDIFDELESCKSEEEYFSYPADNARDPKKPRTAAKSVSFLENALDAVSGAISCIEAALD